MMEIKGHYTNYFLVNNKHRNKINIEKTIAEPKWIADISCSRGKMYIKARKN